MKTIRTTLAVASTVLLLLAGAPLSGAEETTPRVKQGQKLPPPAKGSGRYVMMLWDPGTPVPGSNGKELMKDVPEPDVEKLGGKLLARHGQKRVLDLPPGKAKELRKHRSVMYLQRMWMGEPLEELGEEPDTSGAATVESHSDTGLAWGPKVYSYDPSGNIKEIAKKDASGNSISPDSYAYDTAGRLITATVAGKTEQYEYDAYGNLTRRSLVGSTSVTIPVDPSTNRLVGMAYDQGGNMLRRDSDVVLTGTYEYDAFNMLFSFSRTARRYLYDANDERIGMINQERSEWTIRDFAGRVLREYEGLPEQDEQTWVWQQDYVYAGSQLVGGERMKWGYLEKRLGGPRHYHLDHLGSVRLVTDEDARAVSENDYYPFGTAATKSFQEPLNFAHFVDGARYAGHHRDYLAWTSFETGEYLDYMHARYYDPKLGRFLSVDPGKDWDPKQPQSWNMYAYVRNNPVRFTDPTGKYVCRGDAAAGGCDTIERGLDRMRAAAAGLKNSDPRKAALQAVIKAYGKQGDDTSKISTVWINPRNANGTPVLPSNVNGQAGKNGTMFVSLVNIAAKAGGNADKAFTMLGGTLTHEGKHMLQPAVAAFSGRASLLSLIFYERQAYSLQQGYYAGLGQAQAAPDPDKGALASANEACTRVPCDP